MTTTSFRSYWGRVLNIYIEAIRTINNEDATPFFSPPAIKMSPYSDLDNSGKDRFQLL
jgi:hypothetical protein